MPKKNIAIGLFGVAALAIATAMPAQAGLFGIAHHEPTPAPNGTWNFSSKPFHVFADPSYDGLIVSARCRYVGPREPYMWQFALTNRTREPLSFDVALIQHNTNMLATVAQKWSGIEQATIRHVRIAAGASGTVMENGKLGCPGMEGGSNDRKRYIVAVDNVTEGTHVVRDHVFARYDDAVFGARREYNKQAADNLSGGLQAGIDAQVRLLNNLNPDAVPY